MRPIRRFPVAVLMALCSFASHGAIFRCTEPGAPVTYQETPCADPSVATTLELPAEYPPIDAQKRERLFQQEADLYKRLEARRERESRETIASINRPPAVVVVEPEAPAYIVGWPGVNRWPRTRAASGTRRTPPRL